MTNQSSCQNTASAIESDSKQTENFRNQTARDEPSLVNSARKRSRTGNAGQTPIHHAAVIPSQMTLRSGYKAKIVKDNNRTVDPIVPPSMVKWTVGYEALLKYSVMIIENARYLTKCILTIESKI